MQDYNNYGNYGNNRRKFENFDLGNIDYSGGSNTGGMNEVDMIKERLFQDFLAGQGIIQGNNNNRPHSNHGGGGGGYLNFGYCDEDKISLPIAVTVVAGIFFMGYTLYNQVWSEGGRKRKREALEQEGILSGLGHSVLNGTYIHKKFLWVAFFLHLCKKESLFISL